MTTQLAVCQHLTVVSFITSINQSAAAKSILPKEPHCRRHFEQSSSFLMNYLLEVTPSVGRFGRKNYSSRSFVRSVTLPVQRGLAENAQFSDPRR